MVTAGARYVTALGETDTAGRLAGEQGTGGVLIDVPSGEIDRRPGCRCRTRRGGTPAGSGCCESGTGTFGVVDPATGRYEPSPSCPASPADSTFAGQFAFVGLSQVRETAVFSGIPITERLTERTCGVWVVDIHTGETVAFLKFEDALQEIFAVQVLPGRRFPTSRTATRNG